MTVNTADKLMEDLALRHLFSGDVPKHDRVGYYLDENIMSAGLIEKLRRNNIIVVTVVEREHDTEVSDYIVLADARSLGYMFVTRDRGVLLLHERLRDVILLHERVLNWPETAHPGIMLFAEHLNADIVAQVLMRFTEKSDDYPGIIGGNTLFDFS